MAKIENTFRTNINKNEGAPIVFCPFDSKKKKKNVSIKGNGAYRVCCFQCGSESRGTVQDNNGSNSILVILHNGMMLLIVK